MPRDRDLRRFDRPIGFRAKLHAALYIFAVMAIVFCMGFGYTLVFHFMETVR